MKKLILVLAIALVASPAFAALDVYLVNAGGNVIDVNYSGADADNLPRAFALELTIDGTGTFDSVGSYVTGESTTGNLGYGIYPATIDINSAGVVNDAGDPLAAVDSPGTTDQALPSSHIVLEFASLYYGDGNAPPTSGKLCSLNITPGTATQIVMVEEETYRGGIVLEDGSLADANDVLLLASAPDPATNGLPTGTKIDVDTVLTWTAGAGATSHDVYFGTALPGSPVNVGSPTYDPPGSLVRNTTYLVRVVERNDAGTSAPLDWSFTTRCFPKTNTTYNNWVTMNMPDCWCAIYQCDGDADGVDTGGATKYRVYTNDLGLVTSNWKKKIADTTLNPCADIDHKDTGGATKYRVYTNDLGKITSNWKKKASALPGDCPRAE